MREDYEKAKVLANNICFELMPLIDHPCGWANRHTHKIGVDKEAILKKDKDWKFINPRFAVFAILVPAEAKFPAREAVHGTDIQFDILSWWPGKYIICNEAAYWQLAPFAIIEHYNRGTPVLVIP